MSEDEYLGLTPTQFSALSKQHQKEQERQDFRAALICSVIANVNRGKRQKPYKPGDFMPREKKKQSPGEMLSVVKAMQAAWNKGVDK